MQTDTLHNMASSVLRHQRAEDILMRHIRFENRGAPEHGAKCHGDMWESCADMWEAALGSHLYYHQTAKAGAQERPSTVHHSWIFLSESHLLSFSASHSHKKKRKISLCPVWTWHFYMRILQQKLQFRIPESYGTTGNSLSYFFCVFRRKLWQQAETSSAQLYTVGSLLNNSFQQALGTY